MNPGTESIIRLQASRIYPYPKQPRKYFDEGALRELGESLQVVQEEVIKVVALDRHPFLLTLLPAKKRGKVTHMICDGERRWRAARQRDSAAIVEVREITVASEEELYTRSLRSNHYNQEHSLLEIIQAVARLTQEFGYSIEKAAECLGMHPNTASQYLELASLNPKVLAMMDPSLPDHKRIRHKGAAMALLGLPPAVQVNTAQKIVKLGLSAQAAGKLADEYRSGPRRFGLGGKGRVRKPADDIRVVINCLTAARAKLGEVQGTPGLDRLLRVTMAGNRSTVQSELAQIEELTAALKARTRQAKEAAAA